MRDIEIGKGNSGVVNSGDNRINTEESVKN